MNNSETLFNFLNQKLPKTVNYDELSNLCYALFCTLDILPENLRTLKVSKEILAETFSKLTIEKEIILNCNESNFQFTSLENINNEIYWIQKISECMINDKWPNIENARILVETN